VHAVNEPPSIWHVVDEMVPDFDHLKVGPATFDHAVGFEVMVTLGAVCGTYGMPKADAPPTSRAITTISGARSIRIDMGASLEESERTGVSLIVLNRPLYFSPRSGRSVSPG